MPNAGAARGVSNTLSLGNSLVLRDEWPGVDAADRDVVVSAGTVGHVIECADRSMLVVEFGNPGEAEIMRASVPAARLLVQSAG